VGAAMRARQLLHAIRDGDLLFALSLLFRTEWTEATANGYRTWPHCCTQAGCWKHVTAQWCGCRCWWCGLARRLGQ
jgi:hypothetical protein